MLAIKPDPETVVLCHSCGWYGRIKDCSPMPDCLIECPKCGNKVSKAWADDGSFILPDCLVEAMLDLVVQPQHVIETEGEK